MQRVCEWGAKHGVSRGSLFDQNYGLSFPRNGTRPFNNCGLLARVNTEQKEELLKLGVDPSFISPSIDRHGKDVYLVLIYYTSKREPDIEPLEKDYVQQIYRAYKEMYNVFLLQNFFLSFSDDEK